MNITNISTQIEIAFWTGVVSLLRGRQMTRTLTMLLILLLCLALMGLTAFTWAVHGLPARPRESGVMLVHTPAYLNRPENGQQNLLLVLVDELQDREPDLLGAWMLIYAPSGLKVTFMPIYPAETKAGADLEQTIRQPLGEGLSVDFQRALKAHGLWWDRYLIVDQNILAALVDMSGGIDLGSGRSDGIQVADLLPIADQDAQTAVELQARIARGICERFPAMLQIVSVDSMLKMLSGDAGPALETTDLDPQELLASWNRIREASHFACEFPTLPGR